MSNQTQHGVYLITKDGVAHSYIDRPTSLKGYTNPLLVFDRKADARVAAVKLSFALNRFNMPATTPEEAMKVMNTELYPKPSPIAYVVCARPCGYRNQGISYTVREWTEFDEGEVEVGVPDRSIVFETTDYDAVVDARNALRDEYQLNGTIVRTLAEARGVLKERNYVS